MAKDKEKENLILFLKCLFAVLLFLSLLRVVYLSIDKEPEKSKKTHYKPSENEIEAFENKVEFQDIKKTSY